MACRKLAQQRVLRIMQEQSLEQAAETPARRAEQEKSRPFRKREAPRPNA
jgi:hypothetical protein